MMQTLPQLMESMTADERAVAEVILAESLAFFGKDFKANSEAWEHSPQVRRLGWWTRGGVSDVWGWDELSSLTRYLMESFPDYNRTADHLLYDNFVIRVGGDLAYATFDQYGLDSGEPEVDMPGCSRESRVLAMTDGKWRIVYLSYVHQTIEPQRAAMIRVDAEGRVSWSNGSAQKALRDPGSGLRTLGGRLTTTNDAMAARFRAAIKEASARDLTLDGGRATIPLILEQGGNSELARICWVVTEGSGAGAVLVSLNNLTFAQDQIQTATAVFGLSVAQQHVVQQIVGGSDLQSTAAHLGISVNTARTHLQRIFDKTGARSQAALLRTVMSVQPPP